MKNTALLFVLVGVASFVISLFGYYGWALYGLRLDDYESWCRAREVAVIGLITYAFCAGLPFVSSYFWK